MTYADQLSILNASVKLKRLKADKAFKRLRRGLKTVRPILNYIKKEVEFNKEHLYYINFFTYCIRNIQDFDIESEFKTI